MPETAQIEEAPPASKPPAPAYKVLSGTYTNGLDAKRRFTIPADWRTQMGNPSHVMVMKDWTDKSLIILTPDETEEYSKKIMGSTFGDAAKKRLSLLVGLSSETVPLDTQGRVRLSEKFLAYAGVTSSIVLVGCGYRIQLFAPESVQSDEAFDREEFATAMKSIMGGPP